MGNNLENKKNKVIIIVEIAIILMAVIAFSIYKLNGDDGSLDGLSSKSSKSGSEGTVEIRKESTKLEVEYEEAELAGEYSNLTAKITLDESNITIDGSGAKKEGNTITITEAGTYYITGTSSDVNILIDADKKDEVQLVLDNANITSKTTAPINGIKAKKITITLAENSVNTVTDSSSYSTFTDEEKEEPDGTIFSKTDLVINGSGKLIVNANYKDGIVSKDGLKIANTNIEINSADDGIRGKDYVAIKTSNLKITSKGDGIKSTNDEDEALGYSVIEGGTIKVNSESDGIQAETVLNISNNANINITTTGEQSVKSQNSFGDMRGGFGKNAGNRESSNVNTTKTETSSNETSESSKGLKAGTEITIESGNIEVSSTDDSIHSDGIIIINGGTMKLSTGDDGIHADVNIVINNGNIDIEKCYEGIEAEYIEINGGTISLTASDDGINVGGGSNEGFQRADESNDSSSKLSKSDRKLVINGGDIKVNSTGDGLDSNGSIYINGGTVIVIGPTSDGDAPLDYDGDCFVTGGDIIIYGSNGMWQNPSNDSTQYSLTFQTSGNSGDEVVLKDSSGNTVKSFKVEKAYSAITFSNSNIEKGKTYTLYVNGKEVASLEASSIVSSYGSSGGMGMKQGGMRQNMRR